MILETLALLALTRVDPAGDAHGDGSLAPPTAPVYATMAPFDLVEVSVLDRSELVFRVRLADMPNPGGLEHGITLPVVDLYLDADVDGGRAELLPGPEMFMPEGRGWNVAVRITGDFAYARTADDVDGPPLPVEVRRDDDVLEIVTSLPRPEALHELHALTGVYDPFSETGWRPVATAPSPWAFSSDLPHPPVIDLTADDDEAQRTALATGVLPERVRAPEAGPWTWLMLGGVAIAVFGLVARRFGPSEAPTAARSGEADARTVDDAPRSDGAEASDDAPDPDEEAPERADAQVPVVAGPPANDAGPPRPIDAHDLATALAATSDRPEVVVRPSRATATALESGRPIVVGRSGRTTEAPAATGLAASAAFRGTAGEAESDGNAAAEARRLRTHWADGDGWWFEDPDDAEVGEGWARLEVPADAHDPAGDGSDEAPSEASVPDDADSDDAGSDGADSDGADADDADDASDDGPDRKDGPGA